MPLDSRVEGHRPVEGCWAVWVVLFATPRTWRYVGSAEVSTVTGWRTIGACLLVTLSVTVLVVCGLLFYGT